MKNYNHKKLKLHFSGWIASLVIIVLIIDCSNNNENNNVYDLQVEGIHYQDNSPVRIGIKDGKIVDVKKISSLSGDSDTIFVAPGLIDNQINGYKGYSFVDIGRELTSEGIQTITSGFWEVGVTTYFPTITTHDHNIFLKNCKLLAEAKEAPEIRGSIAGIHMEGPYISPIDGFRGAHPLIHVRKPDWNEFMELYDASEGSILQVSLAPETEGAMEFITKCQDLGINVGLAHHNASAEQINEAIDRGAIIATHLGNALANYIHRWNNPLWPQLANDSLNISMICDGFHLTPEQIRVYYKTKGPNKILVTSDMSPFGGLTPGYYLNAIGDTLELKAEGVVVYPGQNSLSGSASPLSKMVGYVMKVTGCNLATAIQMSSTNQARLYGLDDRGELKPGMRADLILFALEDNVMDLKKTLVEGEVVYESTE
jgi:N-acetylglucosamine-6-phosphate deacetylase